MRATFRVGGGSHEEGLFRNAQHVRHRVAALRRSVRTAGGSPGADAFHHGAVAVAFTLVVAWYRRRARALAVADAPAPLPVDPALRARFEAELRRF